MSKYALCECDETTQVDHSQEDISYGELALYTHAEQVHRHGFCMCEDSEPVYSDCPGRCDDCGDTLTLDWFYGDQENTTRICRGCYEGGKL